jgi:hypothetical protein
LKAVKAGKIPLRVKTISSSNFKVILAVQSRTQKYFSSASGQITGYFDASRLDQRGVRVVTDVERGMRWTRSCRKTNDHDADGEVVWFWHLDADVKLVTMLWHRACDGDKQARSPGRARRKPLTPSRRECR